MVLFNYAMNYHCDVLGFFTPLQTKNRKSLPKNPSLFLICPQFSAKKSSLILLPRKIWQVGRDSQRGGGAQVRAPACLSVDGGDVVSVRVSS